LSVSDVPLPKYEFPTTRVRDNWVLSGNSKIVNDDAIVLTDEGFHNQWGSLYNVNPFSYHNWEVRVTFKIEGNYPEGDEGIGIWITEDIGSKGPIFGSSDQWKVLGVIIDTKDNDNIKNNPSVSAHMFTGVESFNHDNDGIDHQLAGCIADVRNRDNPVVIKITYSETQNERLSVFLDLKGKGVFQRCLSVNNVKFPANKYYLGLSAASTISGDQHIVQAIQFYGSGDKIVVDENIPVHTIPVELEETDHIIHAKIDQLLKAKENAVDSTKLGQALDEIEMNVIKMMNTKFNPLHHALEQLEDAVEKVQEDVTAMKNVGFQKQSMSIEDIRRIVGNLEEKLQSSPSKASTGDSAAVEQRIENIVRRELSNVAAAMAKNESSNSASGSMMWIIVGIVQVLFVISVAIQHINAQKQKWL